MNFRENFSYLNYFGFELTLWKALNAIAKRKKNKLAWRIHDRNDNTIEAYLKKICPLSYQKLKDGYYDDCIKHIDEDEDVYVNKSIKKNNAIWTIWWQGEENAPELVRACIYSMRRHSGSHPVIVIDKDNYNEYLQLPQMIEQRFEKSTLDKSNLKKCTLDITQKSDIMRCYLLYYYGGLWCDATMMFTQDVDERIFSEQWSTLGQDNKWYIGRGKWSSFFMGSTYGNGFIKFNYDMHIEYWTHNQYYVNYLMTDHMFDIAQKERILFRNMVDAVKTGNKKCLTINRLRLKACKDEEAKTFFATQKYHKLSWRWWGNTKDVSFEYALDNKTQTWMDYLFEHYVKEFQQDI